MDYEGVLTRMALWQWQWVDWLSPPIWPLPEDGFTLSTQQVYHHWHGGDTILGDSSQVYGGHQTYQSHQSHQGYQNQMLQQNQTLWTGVGNTTGYQSQERMEQVLREQEQFRQMDSHTQANHVWESAQHHWPDRVSHSQEGLCPHESHSTVETKQITLNLSPTIHLQATVYEQANVEALVERLGRLLEQELAISAERAYS